MTTGRPCSDPSTTLGVALSGSKGDALRGETLRLGPGRLWLAAFGAALVLYVLTLAPDLVWQDGGEYQWTSARLSWPPAIASVWCRPGEAVRVHPWFLVTARALGLVPFWNYAYAANLCSAVAMALAAANIVLVVRLVTGRTAPAVLAGLSFALGHTIWTFAVMSEVLGWTAAFLSAECLLAWLWIDRRQARWLLLLFLVNGAAISNHMMAVFSLAVFGTWMVVECVRRRAPWWVLPAAVGCWLAGGALYWIVGELEYVRTGNLLETVRSMTGGYHGGLVANMDDLPRLLGRSVLYVGLNYPTPLVAAIAFGAVALVRRRNAFGVLVLVLAAVYFLWAARYKVPDQYSFFVPFYVCGSLLIGVGAAALIAWRRWMAWLLVALAIAPVGVYAALPSAAQSAGFVFFERELPHRDPYTYFLRPWKCGDRSARQFAEEVLAALPENAILLPDTTASMPLKCLQDIEGRRPDVRIIDPYDAKFEASVGPYWQSKADLLPGARSEGRRVFVVSEEAGYVPSWVLTYDRLERFGPIFEVKPLRPAGEGP
ncbi:MAG: DUF2723 domain-containing protein [Planctomycetota bacterium]|nr:DUF2723 domain-containing protein [Planctomycetota bacterium]